MATSPLVIFLALLGACVWVGGLAAIAVVSAVARQQLDPGARVAFFRALGRSWLWVGTPALATGLIAGAVLLADRPWDGASLAAVLISVALVVVTAVGVGQARAMTRMRARATASAREDGALAQRLERGAVQATALRAAIAVLSLVLIALASVLAR
jgi:hypothetical protein